MSTLSRRDLFGLFRAKSPGPERREVPPPVGLLLRPPGAIEESAFLSACDKCGACATACPYGSIRLAGSRFGRASGTPVIDPATAPCRLCPDRPCATACAPKALDSSLPAKLGTARIDPGTCLAHRGSFCSSCAERCPVKGAIVVTSGRPRIDASSCAGCGVCVSVCPAPGNAIALLPALSRPLPAEASNG